MLDNFAQRLIEPALKRVARQLVRINVTANQLTLAGFAIGLLAAVLIAQRAYGAGLALLLLSRLCDGLDGAVARQTQPSDRGGFLDITLDFIFLRPWCWPLLLPTPPPTHWQQRPCWRASWGRAAVF